MLAHLQLCRLSRVLSSRPSFEELCTGWRSKSRPGPLLVRAGLQARSTPIHPLLQNQPGPQTVTFLSATAYFSRPGFSLQHPLRASRNGSSIVSCNPTNLSLHCLRRSSTVSSHLPKRDRPTDHDLQVETSTAHHDKGAPINST